MWKLLTRLTALSACLVSALFSRGRRHPAEQSQRRSLAGVAASSELLGAVSDTVLVVGRDGTVVDRNETVETRLPSVESGMPLTEALPELAGTDSTEPTRIKRHPAGETRRYRVETAPVTLLGWLPVGQAVVITDAQRESKGDDRDRQSVVLEQIQRNISDVVWMSDVGDAPMGKQSMEFITDSYADIWERSPESLHENPTQFVDAIHPEDRERVEAALAEQADNPDEYEETYRIRTPDGETKWIHDRSSGVYVDGELQRVIGVATEITARKQREREAKREREFFEQAINALSDVFYVLDTDGTFRRWNQELAAVCVVLRRRHWRDETQRVCSSQRIASSSARRSTGLSRTASRLSKRDSRPTTARFRTSSPGVRYTMRPAHWSGSSGSVAISRSDIGANRR